MKKFILSLIITFVVAASVPTNAQVLSATNLLGGAHGLALDTVTNTGTITKYAIVKYSNNVVGIQATATKISGTMGGTAFPVGSNDGVNFISIAAVGDTVTWSSASGAQTKLWAYPRVNSTTNYFPYLYVGVKFVGTGTMSASVKANAIPRQTGK